MIRKVYMAAWVSVLLSAFAALLTAGIAVGIIRTQIGGVSKGQDRLEVRLSELAQAVQQLSTASAVNDNQHSDLSRRISELEAKLVSLAETIGVLRTRSHLHANKLQELDPSWRPYRRMAAEPEVGG